MNYTELSAFQRDLLWTIKHLDEPTGLDIKRALDDSYGDPVHLARHYQNLSKVVDAGLVDQWELDGRSKGHALTERGIWELAERERWRENWVQF